LRIFRWRMERSRHSGGELRCFEARSWPWGPTAPAKPP
jgi:hypothetical protein